MTTSEAAEGSAGATPSAMKWLRAILLFLVAFDLTLAVIALLFPRWVLAIGSLSSDAVHGAMYRSGPIEPIFLRGVGVLWLLAAYVQLLAWKDPARNLVAVTIAIVFRTAGGTFELIEVLFLLPAVRFGDSLIFAVLGIFAAGDYLLVGVMALLLRRLRLEWWSV